MRRIRLFGLVLAVLSLIALGACGSDDESEAATGAAGGGAADATDEASDDAPFEVPGEPVATSEVDLPKSYKFEPAVIKVAPGTKVTWTNNDNFPHNVHVFGDNERTEDLRVGDTVSISFADPGTYYYECTLHPSQMKGKILVEDA